MVTNFDTRDSSAMSVHVTPCEDADEASSMNFTIPPIPRRIKLNLLSQNHVVNYVATNFAKTEVFTKPVVNKIKEFGTELRDKKKKGSPRRKH